MKKQFVKPEIKGIRLRENILAGSGSCGNVHWTEDKCYTVDADGRCSIFQYACQPFDSCPTYKKSSNALSF